MRDHDAIPISLVSHFQFCPRRAWLEAAGERTDTLQMQIGALAHTRADDPRATRSEDLRAVDVHHREWNVTGRLDALVTDGGQHLIREYKATPVRRRTEVTAPMRTQLALQSACLQAMGIRDVSTEVYFTTHQKRVEVALTEVDFKEAERAVAATRACVTADRAPEPLEDAPQCLRCSHAGVCLPDERRLTSDARRIIVSDPDAQVVHLTKPGSRAFKKAGRLMVSHRGETMASIPMDLIQGLVLHGNIDISSGLMRELLWRDVTTVWCSGTGRLYGWSQSSFGPNGGIRVLQHVASFEGRLEFVREMVSSKIANQATQLRRSIGAGPLVSSLRALQKRASRAELWQDVLGLEGEAASIYFMNWPRLLKGDAVDQWGWTGRSGRPASDRINALLNYGYALLTADAIRAIIACGLDPHAGFLHSSGRNKPALALDLIEEFRAPVVDSTVQTVINNSEIRPSQFTDVLGTWTMDDDARKTLVTAYERRMRSEFRHPIFSYAVTWRRALEIQARQVLGVLDGSQPRYRGIRLR